LITLFIIPIKKPPARGGVLIGALYADFVKSAARRAKNFEKIFFTPTLFAFPYGKPADDICLLSAVQTGTVPVR